MIRVPGPSEDEDKSTAEHAEAAEVFLGKDPKHKSFYGSMLLLSFPSSGIEDKRINEEEAESAEIAPYKIHGPYGSSGKVGKEGLFSPCIPYLNIGPFLPLRAPRPLRLSFFYSNDLNPQINPCNRNFFRGTGEVEKSHAFSKSKRWGKDLLRIARRWGAGHLFARDHDEYLELGGFYPRAV
jgi:hypothetical protein